MPIYRIALWRSLCSLTIFLVGGNLGINPQLAQAQTVTPNRPNQKPPVFIEIPNSNQKTIRVERFIFKGNTVFTDQQLEAVVAAYKKRDLSFDELLQIRAAITDFYNQAGYITSFAFFPIAHNQTIQKKEAIVTIEVLEGKLESIKISGSPRLQQYVRSRLHKATEPVLNSSRLLEALRLLQVDPRIETISAELSDSSSLGKTQLNVKLKARQPFRVVLSVDNSRSPAVGSFQRGLQLAHANLLGLGDEISLSYRNTDGSNAYAVGYSIPINPKNGTIDFSYTNIESNIIERPFNKLDIISDALRYQITYRQPLLQRASADLTREFALGLTAERTESDSSLLLTPFPLSEGADDQGRTKVSALRFFQDWTTRSNREVLSARSQFSLGVGAFNATVNSDEPDSRFFSWLFQAAWLRRFGDTSLLLRADLQLASTPLVSLEQLGLGGASTVRGYRQDTYLADNGLILAAEFRLPVWKKTSSEFQVIPFVDFGTAWNNQRNNNRPLAELFLWYGKRFT